jgi:hypothetical protein
LALESLWGQFITCPTSCQFGFAEAFARFRDHLVELFGSDRFVNPGDLSFFPSRLREPILSAGRAQHLMRVRYQGLDRIVEPYAIRFMIRKDGGGGEYLYVHQRSGGSGSGTRMYVPEDVDEIVELGETFEPQHEVEVTKAGEATDDVAFPNLGRRRAFVPGFGSSRAARSEGRGAFAFRVICNACGKRFPRKKYDTKIAAHHRPDGGRCFATWGRCEPS